MAGTGNGFWVWDKMTDKVLLLKVHFSAAFEVSQENERKSGRKKKEERVERFAPKNCPNKGRENQIFSTNFRGRCFSQVSCDFRLSTVSWGVPLEEKVETKHEKCPSDFENFLRGSRINIQQLSIIIQASKSWRY